MNIDIDRIIQYAFAYLITASATVISLLGIAIAIEIIQQI